MSGHAPLSLLAIHPPAKAQAITSSADGDAEKGWLPRQSHAYSGAHILIQRQTHTQKTNRHNTDKLTTQDLLDN